MNLKFGTRKLFLATFLIGCVMAIVAYEAYWLIGVILGGNLLGASIAVVLTKVLRFPIDGGYRDTQIRKEQDDSNATNKDAHAPPVKLSD